VFVYAGPLPARNQLVIISETTVLRLRYSGGTGQVCAWQRSLDLAHWELLSTVLLPPHGFAELVEALPPTGRAYYRAVQR